MIYIQFFLCTTKKHSILKSLKSQGKIPCLGDLGYSHILENVRMSDNFYNESPRGKPRGINRRFLIGLYVIDGIHLAFLGFLHIAEWMFPWSFFPQLI